jgi:hypothetical protein
MVDSWAEQADEVVSLADVVEAGLIDLVEGVAGLDALGRLVYIRGELLVRKVEKLGGRTLRMAVGVGRGQVAPGEVLLQCQANQQEVHGLLTEVKALADQELNRRVLRLLADADLECQYVLAGGSSSRSLRLSRRLA